MAVVTLAGCASPAPSASPRTVAEMLPTTLAGAEMELSRHDPAGTAAGRLARRVGKTNADVETATRLDSPPRSASRGFITGIRIAGVPGDRLLAEHLELVREQLESEGWPLSVGQISFG